MPVSTWPDLYAARWGWARRATEAFQTSIDESLREPFMEHSGQFAAVLIGPSQVGKTMLLLSMLGVAPAWMDTVRTTLRAGRQAGKSSTAVAMRYRWSPDAEKWSFRIGASNTALCDARSIVDRLEALRGPDGAPVISDEVYEVGIPAGWCALGANTSIPMILDLPGVGAESAIERDHAERLASRYLPTAHVIVIVLDAAGMTRIDELGYLPARELRMWPYAPERFRIVLTRTFTDQTYGNWVVQQGSRATVEELRRKVAEQLGTCDSVSAALNSDRHLAPRIARILFPIEYGDTWAELETAEPERWQLANVVVGSLREDLESSLGSAAAEDSRYQVLAQAVQVIDKISREKISQAEQVVDAATEALESAIRHLRNTEKALNRAEVVREQADRVAKRLKQARARPPKLDRSVIGEITSRPAATTGTGARKRLRDVQRAAGQQTRKAWRQWLVETKWLMDQLQVVPPPLAVPVDQLLLDSVYCCGTCTKQVSGRLRGRHHPRECMRRQDRGVPRGLDAIDEALAEQAREWLKDCTHRPGFITRVKARATIERITHYVAKAKRDVDLARGTLHAAREEVHELTARAEKAHLAATDLDAQVTTELHEDLANIDSAIERATPDDRIGLAVLALLMLRCRDGMRAG